MSEANRPPEDQASSSSSRPAPEAESPVAALDYDSPQDAPSPGGVASRIEEMPAADGAAVMTDLPAELSAEVAEYLDPETAGGVLAEMDPAQAATVIADMEAPEASMVLAAMEPDDRVDILEHVPAPLHDQLVAEMDAREAAEVRDLEQYPPDSAGGIMTTQVTSLPEDLTVEQAIVELRRLNETLEQMFYVYVVDKRRHLVGVLSMRDLILARPNRLLNQMMRPTVMSVPATMDQEEVARIFRKYNYLAMPVVDARNRLIGLITVDDVVDVIQDEATEDVQKMFGAGAEERLNSPWHFSFRKRVWWLEVNLATAFLAAAVVGVFKDVIEALPILAAYQTIVSGMGGNAGAQSMAVAIRGIALGQVDRKQLRRLFLKEFIVGVLTGLAVGLTTWGIAAIFHRSEHGMMLGALICLALLFNHVNACLSGVAIPFVMKWFGFDPAQSATIFATTFTDCGGFFATLGLAKVFQHFHWL
jgi:magnesium transporter